VDLFVVFPLKNNFFEGPPPPPPRFVVPFTVSEIWEDKKLKIKIRPSVKWIKYFLSQNLDWMELKLYDWSGEWYRLKWAGLLFSLYIKGYDKELITNHSCYLILDISLTGRKFYKRNFFLWVLSILVGEFPLAHRLVFLFLIWFVLFVYNVLDSKERDLVAGRNKIYKGYRFHQFLKFFTIGIFY